MWGVLEFHSHRSNLIDDKNYNGIWAPRFEPLNMPPIHVNDTSLIRIDHVVGNVELDKMDEWRKYYENISGFTTFVRFDDSDISTQYSSLKSRVMRSKNWRVRLPINEPAHGLKKSQIQEYLDFNEGPGVQHIAISTSNIIKTIETLRLNGVEFFQRKINYMISL